MDRFDLYEVISIVGVLYLILRGSLIEIGYLIAGLLFYWLSEAFKEIDSLKDNKARSKK